MELKIEYVPIDSIKPYSKNAKLHPAEQIEQIKASIKEFGFKDAIAVWHDECVCGHGRLLAAKELGMKELPIVRLDDLTDEQRRAYALVHNKLTMNSPFDDGILSEELDNILDIDMSMFDFGEVFDDKPKPLLDERYSISAGEVIYEPKDTNHSISDLYEIDDKADYYIEQIKNDEVRKLCELRKASLIKFNFSKIADYYAYQATPEEKRAFEALAMVLLDKDQLIENGYTDMMEEALELSGAKNG